MTNRETDTHANDEGDGEVGTVSLMRNIDFVSFNEELLHYNNWSGILADFVAGTLFNNCQFINSANDLEFGGDISKICCNHLRIPERSEYMFWHVRGAKVVKETIRRCRTSRSMAMKRIFLSTYFHILYTE